MQETITREEYEIFLSLAPTSVLEQVGDNIVTEAQKLPEGSAELEVLEAMFVMLYIEYQRRQVEPLWQKAKRLALRNSDTIKLIGKIAAGVAFGIVIGEKIELP